MSPYHRADWIYSASMMHGESPQGLTAYDFHHQLYINPRDVFPVKSRQPHFAGKRAFPLSRTSSPQSSARSFVGPVRLSCCGEGGLPSQDELSTLDCCADDVQVDHVSSLNLPECCGTDLINPGSDNCDECEDCIEEHKECDEDQIQCVDDCDECLDEHDKVCGQQGQICTETCDDCDFSCFDCVDWNAFERDKSLGLSFSVPLLDQPDQPMFDMPMQINKPDLSQQVETEPQFSELPAAPLELPMHHQCLQDSTHYWNAMVQSQLCPNEGAVFGLDPSIESISAAQSSAGFQFGCHPATIHQPMQYQQPPNSYEQRPIANTQISPTQNRRSTLQDQRDLPPMEHTTGPYPTQNNFSRICRWLMPCGTMCSASFATTADLKRHLKAVHVVKAVFNCSWQGCDARFASEAALTGHVSKKHIASGTDDDGPFKCTFPGCSKSFMYKQVRDEHVASHNGNKMYCHICDQFLNSEGSNFRRHMASHQPKHEHMLCKHHHLGCKRRFPRLDNLRRHEACCKFGKKAALHHHHHHRHVGH